jgi:hypothetical protein
VNHGVIEPDLALTIPLARFREALRTLLAGRAPAVRLRAGRRWAGREIAEIVAGPPATDAAALEIALTERFVAPVASPAVLQARAVLQVGAGALRGQARAWLAHGDGSWARVGRLFLPGPRLRTVRLLEPDDEAAIAEELDAAAGERLSRSIGGLGAAPVRAILRLEVGFVGLGRLGSAILRGLLDGLGVRAVVLVDPDVVERHNCGEGAFFSESDIGHPKVEAWQSRLALSHPLLDVIALRRSAAHREPLEALARCQLIICAADQPGARLAAASVAALHGRMLLDAGVLIPAGNPAAMGADVRLIPPERCLLCCGSVEGEEQGAALLESPDREEEFLRHRDWTHERAGSLFSLNTLTEGIALRMIEDCAAGRIEGPVWCQADFEGGMLRAGPRAVPERSGRPCFCELAGEADAGYAHVLEVLRRRVGMR